MGAEATRVKRVAGMHSGEGVRKVRTKTEFPWDDDKMGCAHQVAVLELEEFL